MAERIPLLFLAALFLGLPFVLLVFVGILHRKHHELAVRTGRLEQSLRSVLRRLHRVESRLETVTSRSEEKETPPTESPAPSADLAFEDPAGPLVEAESAPQAPPPTVVSPPRPPVSSPAPAAAAAAGIERQLGTRVAVWVGAVALAFAGVFLVKYSIEQGVLGPTARVVLGHAFGLVLIGAAEWLRRRSAGVAQGLAASGVAVLFASLLAGVRLYGLIPPVAGVAGFLLTTLIAVVLSSRHGQMVAILGLIGGFLTPLFLGGDAAHPWLLFCYLLLIQTGLLLVSLRMRWWLVVALTVVGGMGWSLWWVVSLAMAGGGPHPVGPFVLVSVLSYVALSSRWKGDDTRIHRVIRAGLVWGGVAPALILLCALLGIHHYQWIDWMFLGILGAGCVALARREARYEGLAWLAMLVSALMVLDWGAGSGPPAASRIWGAAAALVAVYGGGAYLSMWGSRRPHRWAALCGVSAIAFLLVVYATLHDSGARVSWLVPGLLLATALGTLAVPVHRRRDGMPRGDDTLAALVLAAVAVLSVAVPMEWQREWIAVAWAVGIPLLAWIAGRLRLPSLSRAAWALGTLVAVRLLLNPAVLDYPTGQGVLFNWLLYGYGVPILAFAVGVVAFRRLGEIRLADSLEAGSILLGLAYLTLSVRQVFHPGRLGAMSFELGEWGALTATWLVLSLGLLELHRRTGRPVPLYAGAGIGLLALTQGLTAQGLFDNPLLRPHEVGAIPVLNRLLPVYGLPALLAGLLARSLGRLGSRLPARVAGGGALAFAFLLVTLEVRQAFQGTVLHGGPAGDAETYAYSLAWILFAAGLLVAGIVRGGPVLRYASAGVMTLAVGKVFLVDTAHLPGLYRVLSFLGLGVSLMALAFVYQRFVFRDSRG